MTTEHSPDRINELEQRLATLEDHAEITDLLARHGRWLDQKRFDDARSVFTEDASILVASGDVRGADRLAELARKSHGDFSLTHHMTTNPQIEIDGDHATVVAQQIAAFCRDGSEPEFIVGEQYRMQAVRTRHGWRFSRVQGEQLWRIPSSPETALTAS
ncbi:nuclear transport factor 2 family protein [Actinobacteria bacterium YIM 96077]|uniref:Nuclear transport factor 2 family protein n=1 Tax=Phytoactinopolyspora halophila TaxID=1981511 RepID=A0A329QYU3_9ACTN|nr:nuclear transport factor 2 family protein [Phytoactinopolyspora halophila]AYY13201.1 nuclear transport factor 2 family protein [Actinobacteria bacterium YIM 96077]RAW17560.1 nuclear transport factor 2 family protein [Phytoactinopolyspora halophila]